ncbi:MAG: GlgB N-terminal domain-containing protein, partial [Pseudonocardiaceae bacterium]
MTSDSDVRRLVEGHLGDPHYLLGFHDGVVRAWRPGATAMRVAIDDGDAVPMERTDPAGLFEAKLAEPGEETPAYRLEA